MDGNTFKRIRLAMGLTGDELAAKLKVTGSYIRMVECCHKPVSELLEYKIMDQLRLALCSGDPFFELIKQLVQSPAPILPRSGAAAQEAPVSDADAHEDAENAEEAAGRAHRHSRAPHKA